MHSNRPRRRASRPVIGRPSVIIAGAGIVGAALAYHLASAGAAVTIIERSRPASGVTARSFAWINVIHGNAPDIARLRNLAIADYHRLERDLNGALAIDWNGALACTPIDARVGWRPMPADGMPIVGFTPDAPGLYLAVMHAGVVMAPVVGRLATGEIVAGNEAEALAPCRVSRFG